MSDELFVVKKYHYIFFHQERIKIKPTLQTIIKRFGKHHIQGEQVWYKQNMNAWVDLQGMVQTSPTITHQFGFKVQYFSM